MPRVLPNSGKWFPAVDIGPHWHALKPLIINNLFFGTWLEISITTTRSANSEKEQETERIKRDDGEWYWLQAAGDLGDSLLLSKLLNNIYLEGVFCTGADFLIGPFFLCLIVSFYLQTRCKYYIRIYNDSTPSPIPEDQSFFLYSKYQSTKTKINHEQFSFSIRVARSSYKACQH